MGRVLLDIIVLRRAHVKGVQSLKVVVLGTGQQPPQSGAVIGCPSDARNSGRKQVFITGCLYHIMIQRRKAGTVRVPAVCGMQPYLIVALTNQIRRARGVTVLRAMWPFGFPSPWQRLFVLENSPVRLELNHWHCT